MSADARALARVRCGCILGPDCSAETMNLRNNEDGPAPSGKHEPFPSVSHANIHVHQEWEGYVIEIGSRDFTARLIDMTAGDSFDQYCAIIPLSLISESDQKFLQIGKIFRWIIGHECSRNGDRRRVSRIHFLDIKLTQEDLERGEKWADDILAWLESTGAAKDANNSD